MMKEIYLKDGKLIPKKEWESKIDAVRKNNVEDLSDEKKAESELVKALVNAVESRIPRSNMKIAVLLSGGIDSSLIALLLKKADVNFTCYTIGFKNEDTKDPEDVAAARLAARLLGVKLKVKMVNVKEAEGLIERTVRILGKDLANVVNVGVASVEVGCIEEAKKDGAEIFFGGLGSEEIFAGYERHRLASDRQDECWRGLALMYERDLLRDCAVSSALGVKLATPFLDEKLIATAMRIPAKLKIDETDSKIILRKAAERLGLDSKIAWRDKRAAQYGSRLDKAISKIAREKKFKLKKDYLKSLE